ncbi:MAG: GNAT family N-acetyltransferase [Actinomycetota bacterium]
MLRPGAICGSMSAIGPPDRKERPLPQAHIQVRTLDDPAAFLADARPLLMLDEARHNLMLGVVGRIATEPHSYPVFRLWLAQDPTGDVVGAASMTAPWPIALARPTHERAIEALVAAASAGDLPVPGVVGAVPEVHEFASRWTAVTGMNATTRRAEGAFALEEVAPVPIAAGAARPATEADRELIAPWMVAFVAEALPDDPAADDDGREIVDSRLRSDSAGLWLWEVDGRAVSVAGYGGPTPNGIRIGPVYTPPEHRGHGYATSLVAELSAWLIANGRRFCFLYTDLANPTSNAIYRRIGYRQVCESANVVFEPRP